MAEEERQTQVGDEETQTPEQTPAEGQPVEQSQPAEPPVDYEKKFSESTREAQRLLEENKSLNAKIGDLEAKLAQPAPDEGSDYQYLTEAEKRMYRELEELKAKHAAIEAKQAKEDELSKAIGEFAELNGREKEFRTYCEGKSGDYSILAKAFLFENKQTPKRKGLEKPSGGDKSAPASEEITAEKLAQIRQNDEKLYEKLVKEGRVDFRNLK